LLASAEARDNLDAMDALVELRERRAIAARYWAADQRQSEVYRAEFCADGSVRRLLPFD
jgi:hypothetical protein